MSTKRLENKKGDVKAYTKIVTFTLTGYDMDKLEELSKNHRYNKSGTIKSLILAEWEKMFNQNGDACK